MQYLQQKSGAQTQQEFEAYIQQLGEEGLQQEYAQFMQMMQQQQVAARKFGGMLNYVGKLRGICPEGYEMQFFKQGGQICKKCVQRAKMEDGGKTPENPIDAFRCGRKMKKKACGGQVKEAKCGTKVEKDKCGKKMRKKACGGDIKKNQTGGTLPTAEPAAKRYENAQYYGSPIDGWKYPTGNNSIYEEGYVQTGVPFYKNPARIGRIISNNGAQSDTTYYEVPAAVKGVNRTTRQAGSYNPNQRAEYEILKKRFNEVFPRGNGKLPYFSSQQFNK